MQPKHIIGLTACMLWTNWFAVALAHDGNDHRHDGQYSHVTHVGRTWKIGSRTVSRTPVIVEGSMLTADDYQVRLQTAEGRIVAVPTQALTASDQEVVQQRLKQIRQLNTQPVWQLTAFHPQDNQHVARAPVMATYFKPFRDDVSVRWDRDFLFVESSGMPNHNMMVGITAWQQQVPIPQPYTGTNAWRIPLHPVPAERPMSAKTNFFRGAIALAVNGVPIFNPIKNDGRTDTLKAGELDQWGGHCGRADDYHYHIAPVHLEKIVGVVNPIAVALDGYPVYGYNDPNGAPPTNLDWLNGHKGHDGKYHYHATKTYPYLNGGFYGEVVERNGQVDPQPRSQGVRPSLRGLRGAKIVGFENPESGSYIVRYELTGEKHSVQYSVADNGSATFNFVSPQGTKTETYSPRQRGGRNQRRNAERPAGGEPQRNRGRGNGGAVRDAGRDPITAVLDANGDGQIDEAELCRAALSLRKLDTNEDGQITADELRGNGGDRSLGRAGGSRGPQPIDGPRQPWILVHADEIDLDKNKIISRDEIVGEATKAFTGYDANNDGKLSENELGGRGKSRSAISETGNAKGDSCSP